LPPNVARSSDVNALARWACWLRIRVECKCSPGEDLKGNHRRMRDAESALVRLEDRLGLSPAARNSIVQRLFQLPAAHFVAEAVEGEPAQPAPDDDESPLGYLARRGAR
jgi:hypothetical protein